MPDSTHLPLRYSAWKALDERKWPVIKEFDHGSVYYADGSRVAVPDFYHFLLHTEG